MFATERLLPGLRRSGSKRRSRRAPHLSLWSLPSLPSGPVLRRRALAAGLLAVALAAGYMFWLRDSSLVAVEEVSVKGVGERSDLESLLRTAGLEQTTLHVDTGALAAAVAAEPAVRSVSAAADFPHGLEITVDLRRPVAFLKAGGAVVAGDGVVLDRSGDRPEGVPTIELRGDDLLAGGVVAGDALGLVRVLSAAPEPLLAETDSIGVDPDYGTVATLAAGIDLRFGGNGQADQKWKAAAAVLADPELGSVSYIDLAVPKRPVAGGLPPEALDESLAAEEPVAPVEPVVPDPAGTPEVPVEPVPDPAATLPPDPQVVP